MSHESLVFITAAFSLGLLHVIFGPDHYVPFIVMAKTRKWSLRKTTVITALCGIGHIGGAVLLGMIGIQWGISIKRLKIFESLRGEWAAWGLIAFGLVYFVYGLRQIFKRQFETQRPDQEKLTQYIPWALFVIFVFGPCEPLIPIFMYPAMKHHTAMTVLATGAFSAMTLMTMLSIVLIAVFGVNLLPLGLKRFERYGHAFAGAALFLCGCAVQFLGL